MSKKSQLLLLLISVFNLVYNAFLPLHPDEAYYWAWSRHLGLSYYDHPPMIAYLIRLTTLVSHSESAIRLTAVICMTLAAWVVYKLARGLFNERVADIAMLIVLLLPVTQVGYLIVTPDAPLILFWALTMYCMYQALWEEKKSAFYLAGICGGCLLLSKYTGVLLFPAIALFLIASRFRRVLLRKEIYIAALIAFIMFSPLLIWNAQHDWVSFRFQLMHGMGGAKVFNSKYIGDFLGGQAFIVNPVFLLALFYYAVRNLKENVREEKNAFLFWPFLLTFAFFLYGGLFKKSEANWAAPAYITGSVLLAYWIEKYDRRWIYYTGIAFTIVLVMLMKFPEVFPHLPKKLVMKQQFAGYQEIFRQGSRYTQDPKRIILSDRYQLASEAKYYLRGQPEVYVLTPRRVSMYDFWHDDLSKSPPPDAVYFGGTGSVEALQRLYAHTRLTDVLHYQNKYVTRDISVYLCSN